MFYQRDWQTQSGSRYFPKRPMHIIQRRIVSEGPIMHRQSWTLTKVANDCSACTFGCDQAVQSAFQ
jgi:hypothetical protein